DLPVSLWIVKGQSGRLALAECHGLLIGFHALLLEHHHPKPAQLIDRTQKRTFDVPGINTNAIEEAGAINAVDSAQQTQGRGAFLLAGANWYQVQEDSELGPVDSGED